MSPQHHINVRCRSGQQYGESNPVIHTGLQRSLIIAAWFLPTRSDYLLTATEGVQGLSKGESPGAPTGGPRTLDLSGFLISGRAPFRTRPTAPPNVSCAIASPHTVLSSVRSTSVFVGGVCWVWF
jgi:hypothetical protein